MSTITDFKEDRADFETIDTREGDSIKILDIATVIMSGMYASGKIQAGSAYTSAREALHAAKALFTEWLEMPRQ